MRGGSRCMRGGEEEEIDFICSERIRIKSSTDINYLISIYACIYIYCDCKSEKNDME